MGLVEPLTGASGGFEKAWAAHRHHLVDLAFRMLGDIGEAEDVVQEAFSRFLAADRDRVEDERGWLTVVVSRLCLDRIRSARSRYDRPTSFDDDGAGPRAPRAAGADPADRVTLDDNVRLALVVLMEQLSPPERVVFVLHDVFQLPFGEIAKVVGRSPATCRQLAHRARQRVQTDSLAARFSLGASQHRLVTERFISACSSGDFEALVQILAPDAWGDADLGADGRRPAVVHGARGVAAGLLRYWGAGATLVSIPVNEQPALLAFRGRSLAGLLLLTVASGAEAVAGVHVVVDPVKLGFLRSALGHGA